MSAILSQYNRCANRKERSREYRQRSMSATMLIVDIEKCRNELSRSNCGEKNNQCCPVAQ